jgi:hypothetical protein
VERIDAQALGRQNLERKAAAWPVDVGAPGAQPITVPQGDERPSDARIVALQIGPDVCPEPPRFVDALRGHLAAVRQEAAQGRVAEADVAGSVTIATRVRSSVFLFDVLLQLPEATQVVERVQVEVAGRHQLPADSFRVTGKQRQPFGRKAEPRGEVASLNLGDRARGERETASVAVEGFGELFDSLEQRKRAFPRSSAERAVDDGLAEQRAHHSFTVGSSARTAPAVHQRRTQGPPAPDSQPAPRRR